MTLRFLVGQLSEGEEKIQDRRKSFKVTSQIASEKSLESLFPQNMSMCWVPPEPLPTGLLWCLCWSLCSLWKRTFV